MNMTSSSARKTYIIKKRKYWFDKKIYLGYTRRGENPLEKFAEEITNLELNCNPDFKPLENIS